MSNKYVTDYEPKDPFPYDIHGSPFESAFNPTGMVPYPCGHGIPELPPGYPQVHRIPRRSPTGGELPPWASRSWGRSKYLRIRAYGAKNGTIPFADPVCVVCLGEPRPADLTEPANA